MPADRPSVWRSGQRPRIWVTRAQPQAEATADRVRLLGFEPVVAPVLAARPMTGAVVDLAGVDALAFTSAAGVAAFAALAGAPDPAGAPDLASALGLMVFAVGDATAEAARAAGFADVTSAHGDVHALTALIAGAGRRPSLVLNPTAAEPAADLIRLLADRGVAARSVVVYETAEVELQDPPDNLWGLLVHSPRAARAVVRAVLTTDVSGMSAFAISPAAAAPLAAREFARVVAAPFPNEATLLNLIQD